MLTDPVARERLQRSADDLKQLISVGVSGPILAMMANLSLSAALQPEMADEMAAYLGGPIVVHHHTRSLQGEGHPVETLRKEILFERVEIAFGLSPFTVGPTEIVAVLFQLMMAQYADPPLSNVYVWACAHAFAKVGVMESFDEVYAQLVRPDGHTKLTDDQVLHEEPYASVYRKLATEIRAKVLSRADAPKSTAPAWHPTLDFA